MVYNSSKRYNIVDVPELGFSSYTQPNNTNFAMYKLDNIYFKKTNTEKIDLISDVVTNGNYVIFDTETNGINNFGESLPFQIAAIKYRNGEEVNRINLIINIGTIPDDILEMTNFLQEDIDNGMELEDAIIKFNQFVVGEKYILAHNASFDVSIINNALVYTDTYMRKDINVLCSMQFYYTIYKHIFELGISGSSLNQLSHILLGIAISEDERHHADYDVLLVKELIDKIKADIEYDYTLEDSRINRVLKIEATLKRNITKVQDNYNDTSIINWVHDLGEDVNELFTEYYEDYYLRNIEISNAVSTFLTKRSGQEYPEIFLKDELNELTYYIKKNKPFMVIDERYAKTWSKTTTKLYTDSGYEISFFVENPEIIDSDLVIDSPEALTFIIEEYVNNKNIMMKLQMRIQYLLKIIKAHKYKSNFSNYGDKGKGIYFKMIKEIAKNERMIDIMNIQKDYDEGLIDTKDDLYEIKDYNTTLLVEQNLSNLFNLD